MRAERTSNNTTSLHNNTSISKINIEDKKALRSIDSYSESKTDDIEEKIYLSGDQVLFVYLSFFLNPY